MIAPVMTTNIVKCDSEIEIFINFFFELYTISSWNKNFKLFRRNICMKEGWVCTLCSKLFNIILWKMAYELKPNLYFTHPLKYKLDFRSFIPFSRSLICQNKYA